MIAVNCHVLRSIPKTGELGCHEKPGERFTRRTTRMSAIRMLLACTAAIVITSPAQAGLIDTRAPFDGTYWSFGEPVTQTFGQTFTAPSDNVIDSFSLYLVGHTFIEPTAPQNPQTFP